MTNNLKTFFQNKKSFFSDKIIITILLWFIPILFITLLVIDGFIFYRYSYTVVNSESQKEHSQISLDEKGLNQATKILEERQAALQKLLSQ